MGEQNDDVPKVGEPAVDDIDDDMEKDGDQEASHSGGVVVPATESAGMASKKRSQNSKRYSVSPTMRACLVQTRAKRAVGSG